VNKVVPAAGLMDAAQGDREEDPLPGPVAVRTAKMAMNRGLDLDLNNGLRAQSLPVRRRIFHRRQEEGIAAFLEKRKANFTGR